MQTSLATLNYRYGGSIDLNPSNLETAIKKAIIQLTEEEFDRADDEHIQIFITRPDDMIMTAYVDGLLNHQHLTDRAIPSQYKVAESIEDLQQTFVSFANNELQLISKDNSWHTSKHQLQLPGKGFRHYPAT